MSVLKDKTREDFELSFRFYHLRKVADAQSLFKKVLQVNKNDKAAQIY